MSISGKCILCNNTKFTRLFVKNNWDIVKCDVCGFVFVDPLPSDIQIDNFYNKHSKTAKERIGEYLKRKRSRQLRNRGKLKLLERIQRHKGRILDIGCGIGLFVKDTKDRGWDSYGIDVDKEMIEHGKKAFGINLLCQSLQEANFPNEYFDVITMFNLLDHIREPLAFLNDVERILKDTGVIYLNVHDSAGWKATKYKKDWDAYCPPGHLYYYNHKTLNAILDKTGFKFYRIPGVNFKEGIKMLIIKKSCFRKRSYIRDKFEKFIYSFVQFMHL